MGRALDPKLTPTVRRERERAEALTGRITPGSSIAVVGAAPGSGATTVAALLGCAFAEFQGAQRVLAIDADPASDLHRRLVTRPGAPLDEILRGLGVRASEGDTTPWAGVGYRWLTGRLASTEGPMMLARAPGESSAFMTESEYPSALQRLGRWFPISITDVDPADAGLLTGVLRAADRVLVVSTADDTGVDWLRRALPWISGVLTGMISMKVISVLVQHAADTPPPAVDRLSTRAFLVPYDPSLENFASSGTDSRTGRESPSTGTETLDWKTVTMATRDAVLDLTAELAADLTMSQDGAH